MELSCSRGSCERYNFQLLSKLREQIYEDQETIDNKNFMYNNLVNT